MSAGVFLALATAGCSPAVSDPTSIPPASDTRAGTSAPRPASDAETSELPDVEIQSAAEPNGLVEVRIGAGLCTGACWTRMTFDGADFRYESKNHDGEILRDAVGELTTDGADQISDAIALLADIEIQDKYDLPDQMAPA